MTDRDIQKEFEDLTLENCVNSQGEPDIDYVIWLEKELIEARTKSQKSAIPIVSEMFCVMVDSKKTLSFHKTEKGANDRVTEWEQSQFEGVFHVEKIQVEG